MTRPPPTSGADLAARTVRELSDFVRFPSVSAQPQHAGDVARCADWLARRLGQAGLERVQVVRTPRHPLVTAQWRRARGRPTVLVYGHYDVVPADAGAWHSGPFEPTVRGEYLYGRGASDDKGPLLAHVQALERLMHAQGGLPVNVVLLLDGEEEIGSPHLRALLERHREQWRADVAVISDTRMLGPHRPTLVRGLRGSLSAQLEVCGPPRDLHSGSFGGAVHNPAQVLCELIAGLHDAQGRVRLPGFYARVRPPGPAERDRTRQDASLSARLYRDAGVRHGWGEHGFSAFERTTLRPALVVTGLSGGYAGPGHKSVLPARASARLNIRLVPGQDPQEIERGLRAYLAGQAPPTVQTSLTRFAAARPVVVDLRHPAMQAARTALRESFGCAPALIRSGGTIPVVNLLREVLGLETVLMGFALPDDGMHSVNERFHLPTLQRAISACIRFYEALARTSLPRPPGLVG